MISANEALSLYINTLPKIKEALEKAINSSIKEAATYGKRNCSVNVSHRLHSNPDFKPIQSKVVSDLKELGYTVSYRAFNDCYREGYTSMDDVIVDEDMGYDIEISW